MEYVAAFQGFYRYRTKNHIELGGVWCIYVSLGTTVIIIYCASKMVYMLELGFTFNQSDYGAICIPAMLYFAVVWIGFLYLKNGIS